MEASNLRRVRMVLEYDGGNYSGWQRQINAISVQQVLEEAIEKLTGSRAGVVGSSRTDAGVHALGLNVHFDTVSPIPDEKFSFALNTVLPEDIRVRVSMSAPSDFHARYGAKGKLYCYTIYNNVHASAILRNMSWHVSRPLQIDSMGGEAKALIGTHDFAAFAASGSIVKDTVRTIYAARVETHSKLIRIWVLGDGFLYNMVRIIAGTLASVGTGKLERGAIERAILTSDRLSLGVTAPSQGLTLAAVYYDERQLDRTANDLNDWNTEFKLAFEYK